MIGWKIMCTIEDKNSKELEVVAEVASEPIPNTFDGCLQGYVIMVYHDKMLKPTYFNRIEWIKVIERST